LHVNASSPGLFEEILESASTSKSFFGAHKKTDRGHYLEVPTGFKIELQLKNY
jgi:hypothetical protein